MVTDFPAARNRHAGQSPTEQGAAVDLPDGDLHGADRRDGDVNGADRCDGDVNGADIRRVDRCDGDLHGADLHGVDRCDGDLHGADLHGVDRGDGDVNGADIRRVDLRDGDPRDGDLRGFDLRGFDLCEDRMAIARLAAESVTDPELPILTLADLGVLRDVVVDEDGVVIATLTPTYSGCPAMAEMRADLHARLRAAGFAEVRVRTVLNPPWTTDWITPEGRRKLVEHGIAPPGDVSPNSVSPGNAQPGFVPSGTLSPGNALPGTGLPGTVARRSSGPIPLQLSPIRRSVGCPRCGSPDTEEISRFGATSCKSLWRCRGCLEPFEHIKEM